MSLLWTKRPADRLDYDVDFEVLGWLPEGDAIASVDSVTADADSEIVVDDYDSTATVVRIWLSGGEVDTTAMITLKVTTEQGREKEHCFRVRIRERC